MLILFSLMLFIPISVSLIYNDGNLETFLNSFLITLFFGLILYLPNIKSKSDIKTKEGFLIVVLFWLILSLFGSIPFMFDEQLSLSFVDAFFESISGFTTTGSTVLTNIEQLPVGLKLWRGLLQWFGGIGVVVMAMVFLPALRIGGMQLFRTEGFDTFGKIFLFNGPPSLSGTGGCGR